MSVELLFDNASRRSSSASLREQMRWEAERAEGWRSQTRATPCLRHRENQSEKERENRGRECGEVLSLAA